MSVSTTSRNQIAIYLKNGALDYFYGVSLLRGVSKNKALLNTLIRKENDYNLAKLIYELKKFLPTVLPDPDTDQSPAEYIPEPVPEKYHSQLDTNIRKAIDALTTQKNQLYAKRTFLHPKLELVSTDKERYELAFEIHKIQPQIDTLRNQIEHIKTNKRLPEEVAQDKLSAAAYKKLQNYKAYIRKYSNDIETAETVADKQRYQRLVATYKSKIDEILKV